MRSLWRNESQALGAALAIACLRLLFASALALFVALALGLPLLDPPVLLLSLPLAPSGCVGRVLAVLPDGVTRRRWLAGWLPEEVDQAEQGDPKSQRGHRGEPAGAPGAKVVDGVVIALHAARLHRPSELRA